MQVDKEALKTRASTVYEDFTAGQKATLAVAVIGLIVGGVVFMQWASATTYRPLYAGLEPADAAEVTAELDSMGVSYKLEDAGRTISVPREDVHRTRIDMSAQGLPSLGSPGYDLLDDQSITTSEFRQRIDLQRAMEGELASTIAAIGIVDRATVHLVMPKDDLFSGDDVHASASVLISPVAGETLAAGQVQAIVHLVASSVEGLVPDAITVADDTGRVLSAPGAGGLDVAAGEARLGQKLAFESALARSIENDLLAPITGVGKARVVVSAELDFDERESVSESFAEPDTSPVVSNRTSTENYIGAGGAMVGGVLGPEVDPTLGGGGDNSTEFTSEDSETLFGVDKVTEQVTSSPGRVSRLSIAVVIDESAGIDTAEVESLVVAAAGLQPARGDQIQVSALAFGQVDVPVTEVGTSSVSAGDDTIGTAIRSAAVLLLILVVLFLAYRSAKKSSLARYPVSIPLPADAQQLLKLAKELEAVESGQSGADDILQLEPSPQLVLQNQIGELVDRQPEDVAAVLRTWLADRRG